MVEESEGQGQSYRAPQRPEGYRSPHQVPLSHGERRGDFDETAPPPVRFQMPQFLGAMRIRHVVTMLASQAVAYLTLVVLGVVSCLLFALGASVDNDLAEVDVAVGEFNEFMGPPEFTDIAALIAVPFQLAGLWLFGTLQFETGLPAVLGEMLAGFMGPQVSADMTFTLWAPNLLVLGIALCAAVWIGRRFARRGQSPLTQLPLAAKLVLSLVVSAVMAGLTVLLTWALAFRQSLDFAELWGEEMTQQQRSEMAEELGIPINDLDMTFYGTSAGLHLFFGALVVYLLIGLMIASKKGLFGATFHRAANLLPGLIRTPRVMAIHSLVIVIPALVYVCIRYLADDSAGAVLTFPLWVSSIAVIAFILLTSGAIDVSGTMGGAIGFGQEESVSMTFYLWSSGATDLRQELLAEDEWVLDVMADGFAWWEIAISIIIGLLALFLAALTWSMVREQRRGALAGVLSFLTLPLAYALLGVGLTLFGRMRMEMDMMSIFSGEASVGPVWWTFLILLVVGAAIEALARVCAAFISPSMPPLIRRILGGKHTVVTAPSAGHGVTAQNPQPQPHSGPPQPDSGNSPTMP